MNILYSSQFGINWKFIGKNLGPSLFTRFTLLELVDSFRKKVIGLALSKGADSKLRSLEASLNQVVLRSAAELKCEKCEKPNILRSDDDFFAWRRKRS